MWKDDDYCEGYFAVKVKWLPLPSSFFSQPHFLFQFFQWGSKNRQTRLHTHCARCVTSSSENDRYNGNAIHHGSIEHTVSLSWNVSFFIRQTNAQMDFNSPYDDQYVWCGWSAFWTKKVDSLLWVGYIHHLLCGIERIWPGASGSIRPGKHPYQGMAAKKKKTSITRKFKSFRIPLTV